MHHARWKLIVCSCVCLLGAKSGRAQDPGEAPKPAPSAPEPTPPGAAPNEAPGLNQKPAPSAPEPTPPRAAPNEAPGIDPELAGSPPSEAPAATTSTNGSPPQAAEVRLVLHTRGERDFRHEDPREEIWQSTTVAALDASLRRSESLRFSLGILARYHVAALAHNVPDADGTRVEFDAIPTTGYVDASLANGWHVRAGYQPVALGRFDVFSATNVLAVHDLRDGVSRLPEVPELGQLAVMSDLQPVGWLSVRAIYVPFFTPHIIPVTEGRYALFPSTQADIDSTIDALDPVIPSQQLRALLAENLSRADRERISASGLAAFAPEPTLAHPQVALRATAHSSAGELAMTLSTALEHLPAFRISDALLRAQANPGAAANPFADPHAIRVEYNRFAVLSVDGALDVDPVTIGFELAYMLNRTLYAVGTSAAAGSPYAVPVPDTTDVAQLGARVEYAQNSHWLGALEAFVSYTLSLPRDTQRAWMFLEAQRFYAGAGGIVGYSADFGLHLELAGVILSDATFIATPRIAYALLDNLEIELGAVFIEGRPPPPAMIATANLSIGGLLDGADHAFLGVRYTP